MNHTQQTLLLLLKRWAEKAAGLRYLHSITGGKWKTFADYSSLTAILVTILASGASLCAAWCRLID